MQVTAGYYLMKNGRKARIDSIKDNGQGVGSYQRKPSPTSPTGRIRWQYWVWEANGKAKFVEPSMLDLVEKLV